MIRDMHYKLAAQINQMQTLLLTQPPIVPTARVYNPNNPTNNAQDPGLYTAMTQPGEFGDQEFNENFAVNSPAITRGGSN